MADITNKELQTAREAAGLYQYQVAHLMHVSEDVISRWERGETKPDPDQVDALEKLYNAPGLWYGWMRFQYKSFRDRYPDDPGNAALALSMVNAQYEVRDMVQKQEEVIRDALDGKIDNETVKARYIKECHEARAALTEAITRLEGSA